MTEISPPPAEMLVRADVDDTALDLLRTMLLIRRFEERCAQLYSETKIRRFMHARGVEAPAVLLRDVGFEVLWARVSGERQSFEGSAVLLGLSEDERVIGERCESGRPPQRRPRVGGAINADEDLALHW